MTFPKELTTVTIFSKILALLLFITLPIVAFIFGMSYQKATSGGTQVTIIPTPTINYVACTEEAKICPDGSSVGRVLPDCEFAPCPDDSTGGTFCGGIAGLECPEGYTCQLDGDYPDAGGTCVKNNRIIIDTDYECPESSYVDCMPGPDRANPDCNPNFLNWAEVNCPGFEGAAY